MLHMLEVCEVRSSFLKLMIMITHIKMMQIPYLDIWSLLLSKKGASYELFKSLLWDVQRHVIPSSKIILEENNLPLIIT